MLLLLPLNEFLLLLPLNEPLLREVLLSLLNELLLPLNDPLLCELLLRLGFSPNDLPLPLPLPEWLLPLWLVLLPES